MRPVLLGIAAAAFAASAAFAQTDNKNSMPPATSATPATSSSQPAASGRDNQAVATTNANAATPAHGHNSFTRGEARRRIAAEGFTRVTGLRKDAHGVWRGQGTKNGTTTGVWLDYKGNVGTAQS